MQKALISVALFLASAAAHAGWADIGKDSVTGKTFSILLESLQADDTQRRIAIRIATPVRNSTTFEYQTAEVNAIDCQKGYGIMTIRDFSGKILGKTAYSPSSMKTTADYISIFLCAPEVKASGFLNS